MKIISISTAVRAASFSGHQYWWHKKLSDASKELQLDFVIAGPRGEDADFIVPVLHFDRRMRAFYQVNVFSHLSRDVHAVMSLKSDNEQTHLMVYEGGLREFALCSWLLSLNRGMKLIFNFNLNGPWIRSFESKNVFARYLRRELRKLSLTGRLIALAETPEVAKNFETLVGCEFSPFPIFSILEPESMTNTRRGTDVSCFPANVKELDSFLDALSELPQETNFCVVPRWGFQPPGAQRERIAALGGRIVLGALSEADYASIYFDTKVAVFAWDGDYYRQSSSGRVLDAAQFGAVIVAPDWSSPGKSAEKSGWGFTFKEFELSSVIARALASSPLLRAPVPDARYALRQLFTHFERHAGAVSESHAVPFRRMIVASLIASGVRSFAGMAYAGLSNWIRVKCRGS